MKIYNEDTISNNDFYGGVMVEINELYETMGEPDEFPRGETRRATTGNHADPYWDSNTIGDWDGDEDEVAEWAQDQLNDVYHGLGMGGNGGICHYYTSPKWDDFVCAAEEIIDAFHEVAYNDLCDNYEDYGL